LETIESVPKFCKIPVNRADLPVRVKIDVVNNFDFPERPHKHNMIIFLSQNTPNPNAACHDMKVSCTQKTSITFTCGNTSQKYAAIYFTLLSDVGLRLSISLNPTFSKIPENNNQRQTDQKREQQRKADELEDLAEEYMAELLDYYKANTDAPISRR
jgi:hypothetical protein